MSIVGYLLTGAGTLIGALVLDLICEYPHYRKRSKLDPAFITRIRWWERLK